MRYIYESNKSERVMHIQRFNLDGSALMKAICRINLKFNRTINAPFALGRKVCKRCIKNKG